MPKAKIIPNLIAASMLYGVNLDDISIRTSYIPHEGKKEKERRRKQIERGILNAKS